MSQIFDISSKKLRSEKVYHKCVKQPGHLVLNRHFASKHSNPSAKVSSKPPPGKSDAYPVLIETNPLLSDEENEALETPLPDDGEDFYLHQFPNKKIARKENKKQI